MQVDGSKRQVIQLTGGVPVSIVAKDGLVMWINQNMANFYSYEFGEFGPFNEKSILKIGKIISINNSFYLFEHIFAIFNQKNFFVENAYRS